MFPYAKKNETFFSLLAESLALVGLKKGKFEFLKFRVGKKDRGRDKGLSYMSILLTLDGEKLLFETNERTAFLKVLSIRRAVAWKIKSKDGGYRWIVSNMEYDKWRLEIFHPFVWCFFAELRHLYPTERLHKLEHKHLLHDLSQSGTLSIRTS